MRVADRLAVLLDGADQGLAAAPQRLLVVAGGAVAQLGREAGEGLLELAALVVINEGAITLTGRVRVFHQSAANFRVQVQNSALPYRFRVSAGFL